MASEVEELLSFLDDSRAEVRAAAAEIVAGLTASAEGADRLKGAHRPLAAKLFTCVGLGGEAARRALVALVNLSHDPALAEQLLELGCVGRVMESIREASVPHVDLLSSLLANVTISPRGCRDLLQIGQGSMEGLHMAVLLKKFVVGGITLCAGDPDPFEHMASVLTNVTRLPEARRLLLQPGRGLLHALVSQLQSPNALRRLGASGAIKNCVMSAEEDGTLASIIEDRTLLQHMLRPINGMEPLEKEDTVRECMAEVVLVLVGTAPGRDALWEAGAPEALRKGYEDEQHPGVCMAMERTAEILISHGSIDSGAAPTIVGVVSHSAQQQQQEEQQRRDQQQQQQGQQG